MKLNRLRIKLRYFYSSTLRMLFFSENVPKSSKFSTYLKQTEYVISLFYSPVSIKKSQ